MARFYAKIDTFNIDMNKFTKAMERDCKKLLRLATQKWMLTVLNLIPVRTGFLAGAFTPLENLVGVVSRNAQTGASLGKIQLSRNPLLTNEKKLHLYKKELKKLESQISQDSDRIDKLKDRVTSVNEDINRIVKAPGLRATGKSKEIDEGGKSIHKERTFGSPYKKLEYGEKLALIERQKRLRETTRRFQIEDKIDRIKKRIFKLENSKRRIKSNVIEFDPKSKEYGTSKIDVMRKLDIIRQLKVKVNGKRDRIFNPQIDVKTYTFKGIDDKIYKKERGPRYHHAYVKEYIKVKRQIEVEAEVKKTMTKLDKLRAAKEKKEGIKTKVMKEVEERVFSGKYILKKRLINDKNKIYAHKEYYRHTDRSKTLKTPRSGIKFSTPEGLIFKDFEGDERSRFDKEMKTISNLQRMVEGTKRFQAEFAATHNAESTITGTISSGKYNAVPTIGGSNPNLAAEMKNNYDKIMTKNRTAKMFFSFYFKVNITYLGINDVKIPWYSMHYGRIAFLKYIEDAVKSRTGFRALSNLNDFIVHRSIKFDGSAHSIDTITEVTRGVVS